MFIWYFHFPLEDDNNLEREISISSLKEVEKKYYRLMNITELSVLVINTGTQHAKHWMHFRHTLV
jgi:hypothetical protein